MMTHPRAFHRSSLRAFYPSVMTVRAAARHFRAPVVLLDIDRNVTGAVWSMDAEEAAYIAAQRGAPALAEVLRSRGNERATRVLVLSRQGASLWLADGALVLLAERWKEVETTMDGRKTVPMAGPP
jgi:hypothetical protein